MVRTEAIVRNMLAAIEASLYDLGVLTDRGMLPGLDTIPTSKVIERLALLKYRNARGSHIYLRPSGEYRFRASSKYQDRPAAADIASSIVT